MFGPRLEVGGGKVLEIVRAAAKLAAMVAAVIQVKYVIAAVMETRRHIPYPTVVSGRVPVLHRRDGGLLGHHFLWGDCRERNRRHLHILGIELPRVVFLPLRIAKRKLVVEQFAVNIHRPARPGEIEDDFMLAFRLLEQSERNPDGHILPVRMLGGMEHHRRLQHRHRAIGHFEGRIILPVAIDRIMLPQPDAEHIGDFQHLALAGELL